MVIAPSVKQDLLAAIPPLRAFAISLAGSPDRADDLVQETLVKAWTNLASYRPGTNLRAWLFTILRNEFYSQYRKKKREVEDVDDRIAGRLATAPDQFSHLEFEDFRLALQQLRPDQREALILIGGTGLSYEETADVCGCAVGTIKSRVNRARARLAQILGFEDSDDFCTEPQWRGTISTNLSRMITAD